MVLGAIEVYYFLQFREKKNRQILNLEIDRLTTQHKELAEKYKDALASGSNEPIESVDQRLLKKAIDVVEKLLIAAADHGDVELAGVSEADEEVQQRDRLDRGIGPEPREYLAVDTRLRRVLHAVGRAPARLEEPVVGGVGTASASRGDGKPNRGNSDAVRAMIASTASRVSARGTSASGMWTVASTNRRTSE